MRKRNYIMSGMLLMTLFSTNALLAIEESEINIKPEEDVSANIQETAATIQSQVPNVEMFLQASENRSIEKQIEVNSVNFIRLKTKPNEIFIPNPKVADVDLLDDSSLYLMGLAPGVTSLVAHDKNGNVIADYLIKVTPPISRIKKAIHEVYPELDLTFAAVDSSLLVKGQVPSPEMASDVIDIVGRFIAETNIINKLTIATSTQVMLKVKIAEVSRSLTKSLGINWRALSLGKNISGMSYGFYSNAGGPVFPEFGDMTALRKALSTVGEVFQAKSNGGQWVIHTNGNNGGLTGLIEALANEEFASVLAEPTLITLSGKKATFQSGGEQGYVVKQSTTSDSNTTAFKEWGTSIEFTPVVLSEDRINITVKPVVSTVSGVDTTTGDGTPSLTTKKAETTVELGSGQSLAIAGLLQRNQDTSAVETPFLADIPVLGSLFRRTATHASEKELIIIVTPYIVKPSSKQLKLPTDMVPRMYSPLESIISRRFHKPAVKLPSAAGFSVR